MYSAYILEVASFPWCDELVIQKFTRVWYILKLDSTRPTLHFTCLYFIVVHFWWAAHDTINATLQLVSVGFVGLQVMLFDRPMGLVILFMWTEDEVPLHSFTTNSEPPLDEIFCGLLCYCRM